MEGELSLGMEGELSLGAEGVLSLGMEGPFSLGMEGVLPLGMEGVLSLGIEGVLSLGMEGELMLGMEGVMAGWVSSEHSSSEDEEGDDLPLLLLPLTTGMPSRLIAPWHFFKNQWSDVFARKHSRALNSKGNLHLTGSFN